MPSNLTVVTSGYLALNSSSYVVEGAVLDEVGAPGQDGDLARGGAVVVGLVVTAAAARAGGGEGEERAGGRERHEAGASLLREHR